MAIIKYIPYKSGNNSTPSALGGVINYCLKPDKTKLDEKTFATSGQNCSPDLCFKQFMATKASFGKLDGVYFYHYVQSFSPDEKITPTQANEIGLELAKEWDGYEVLVATHIDREHIHNHFIINSVSFESGKKLHETPTRLEHLRRVSDEICAAHGLKTLAPYAQKPKTFGVGNGEYRSAVRRESFKFHLCGAIDTAMESSFDEDDFIKKMNDFGYGVRWDDAHIHITYTCLCEPKFKNGAYRKCRDNKLHEEKYLKENMENEFKYRKEIVAVRAYGTEQIKRKFTETLFDDGLCDTGRAVERDDGNDDILHGGDRKSVGEAGGDKKIYCEYGEKYREQDRQSLSVARTGWEKERGIFKSLIEGNGTHFGENHFGNEEYQKENIYCGDGRGIAVIGTVGGAALAIAMSGEKKKTKEEIEAEQGVENAGALLGAAIGLVAGAVMAERENDDIGENDSPIQTM